MVWLAHRIRQRDYAFTKAERLWLERALTKFCVPVESEEQLLAVVEKAQEACWSGSASRRGRPSSTVCRRRPAAP